MLLHGQEVGEDLGGMELVGEAVPDGDAGIGGQFFDPFLAVAAVFDAVEHAAEHAGGVLDGLLHADL